MKLLSKHYETWKAIPDELIDRINQLDQFMSWDYLVTQIVYSLIDLILYTEEPPSSIEELDKKVLDIVNKYWVFYRENYKFHCSFLHIFWGWYEAWYYSYKWAEIIEADFWEEIKKMWIFERSTWDKILKSFLTKWSKLPANKMIEEFLWRSVSVEPFNKRYGLK
jgi:Zn-dependent oligopeptidase